MCDSTQKAEGQSPEAILKREAFDRVHWDWLAARAAFYDPDAPEDDESANRRAEKHDAAERALLTMPAPLPWCVWIKWQILDRFVTSEADSGPYHDNRVITALGAIKADVLRFGLKDPE